MSNKVEILKFGPSFSSSEGFSVCEAIFSSKDGDYIALIADSLKLRKVIPSIPSTIAELVKKISQTRFADTGVMPYLDSGVNQDLNPFLVTVRPEGIPLGEYNILKVDEIVTIIRNVANSIKFLHSIDLLQRELDPVLDIYFNGKNATMAFPAARQILHKAYLGASDGATVYDVPRFIVTTGSKFEDVQVLFEFLETIILQQDFSLKKQSVNLQVELEQIFGTLSKYNSEEVLEKLVNFEFSVPESTMHDPLSISTKDDRFDFGIDNHDIGSDKSANKVIGFPQSKNNDLGFEELDQAFSRANIDSNYSKIRTSIYHYFSKNRFRKLLVFLSLFLVIGLVNVIKKEEVRSEKYQPSVVRVNEIARKVQPAIVESSEPEALNNIVNEVNPELDVLTDAEDQETKSEFGEKPFNNIPDESAPQVSETPEKAVELADNEFSLFLGMLVSKNYEDRIVVAKDIIKFCESNHDEVVDSLRILLKDQDVLVRGFAVFSYAKCLGSNAENDLKGMLKSEESDVVKTSIEKALLSIRQK